MDLKKLLNIIKIKSMISFIIPTINEVENIFKTVEKIKQNFSEDKNFEIIFVDDKSEDGTLEKIQEISKKTKNIKLIISKKRNGLGNALLQGQTLANGDYIFFLDCDDSISSDNVAKIIKSKSSKLLVIGSRYIKGSKINGVNAVKVFLSRFLNFIISKYLNIQAIDISHSCRLFPKEIFLKTNNFKHPVFFWEHTLFCVSEGYSILEVPVDFDERKSGKTKNSFFNLFKNILTSIKKIISLKYKYKS